MSTKIVISGRYTSYECESIDEAFAKKIIEHGISSDDLDDLSFEDGAETGLIEAQVQVNDEVVETFSLDDVEKSSGHSAKIDWVLIKEEVGRIVYEPQEIGEKFSGHLLAFHKYVDSFNGYKFSYATPSYDGKNFELDWSSPKVSDLILIDPQGNRQSIDQIEDEDELDEDNEAEGAGDNEPIPPGVHLKNEAFAILEGGNPKGAIVMMREAQSIHLKEYAQNDPDSIDITISLASMLSDEGGMDEAHEILITLLKIIDIENGEYSQEYAKVCGWIARNFKNQQKWSEVLQYSERHLLYFHEPDRWYDLGLALEKLGRKQEAEAIYEAGLSHNDDEQNPFVAMNLLWALYRTTKGEVFCQSDRIQYYLEGAIHFAEIIQDEKMLVQLKAEI